MFWLYFLGSLQFLYRPPFCIPTLIFIGSASAPVLRQRLRLGEVWARTYPTLLIQGSLYILTLVIGTAWTVNWNHPGTGPNKWALRAVAFALILSFLSSIYWVTRMKGQRWYAASIAALETWFLLGANYIASMGILGKD